MMHSRDWHGAGWRCRAALVLALLGVAGLAPGCDEAGEGVVLAAEPACSARVIVRFATVPDGPALAAIERANALELEPLGTITADTGVYLLGAAGVEADCRAAIDRLRSDERVRSVDLDVRRAPHEAQPTTREKTL
jgi:hypothetical protein